MIEGPKRGHNYLKGLE